MKCDKCKKELEEEAGLNCGELLLCEECAWNGKTLNVPANFTKEEVEEMFKALEKKLNLKGNA